MPHDENAEVWRPRVTVAAVVTQGGRFLMVEESVRGRQCLNQPAGHLEPNEDLADAMVRETLEETGWTVRATHFVAMTPWVNPHHGDTTLRFTFAAEPVGHDPDRVLDTGILRAVWMSREEIAAQSGRLRTPMVLTSIDAWLAGQRLPLHVIGRLGGPGG